MAIKAKFQGTCNKCRGRISIGASINWKAGEGASHETCAVVETKGTSTGYTFKKFEGEWCIKTGLSSMEGETVEVQKRDGTTTSETLGEEVEAGVYSIEREERRQGPAFVRGVDYAHGSYEDDERDE